MRLVVKIVVTACFVAVPFLLLPKTRLEETLIVAAPASTLFRLYGMAITALLIGYAFGISTAENGRVPGIFFTLLALALAAAMAFSQTAVEKAW